jgi:hypothetical protein
VAALPLGSGIRHGFQSLAQDVCGGAAAGTTSMESSLVETVRPNLSCCDPFVYSSLQIQGN